MPVCEREALLAFYAPHEPLGSPEDMERWPDEVHALRDRFPGYQPGSRYQENMKYGRRPPDDAPLMAWVTTLLNHAKAKWSVSIGCSNTDLQFAEWLPLYLEDEVIRWSGEGKLDAAAQFLRATFGMPPLPPTRGAGR
jgi:hypothetical protein